MQSSHPTRAFLAIHGHLQTATPAAGAETAVETGVGVLNGAQHLNIAAMTEAIALAQFALLSRLYFAILRTLFD